MIQHHSRICKPHSSSIPNTGGRPDLRGGYSSPADAGTHLFSPLLPVREYALFDWLVKSSKWMSPPKPASLRILWYALPIGTALSSDRSEIQRATLLALFRAETTAPHTQLHSSPRPSPIIVSTMLILRLSKSCGRILSILASHLPPVLHVSSSHAGAMSFLKMEQSMTPNFDGDLMLLNNRQNSSTVLNACTFFCSP